MIKFFCHIPKNGGISIRSILTTKYGKGHFSELSLLNNIFYKREDCVEIIKNNSFLKAYSSHKVNFYNLDNLKVDAFTLLRDPVDRFISRYFYLRGVTHIECKAKEMSLLEFFNYEVINKQCAPQTHSQVYHLSGGMGFDWLIDSVRRNNFRIFLERQDVSNYLEGEMPHLNKSDREPVDEDIKEIMLPYFEEDLKLINYVKNN